jgi:hypothetical protein
MVLNMNRTLPKLVAYSLLSLSSVAAAAPPAARVSTDKDRSKVTVTIYNQNFGLVREVRTLDALPNGEVSLEFADVAATIQPETVHIRSLTNPQGLAVLEQNYRYDLLTPEKLLEKYVGRPVRVYRYHEAKAEEQAIDAKLLSVAGGPILQIGKEITFGYGGRFAFPQVPEDLIARPTLMWLLESRQPKQSVEVSYLAREMSWNADYVMVLDDKETRADLTGWVTLSNQTGASYKDAELKLVAGDVNRVEPQGQSLSGVAYKSAQSRDMRMREESLFEYHLYTLGRPTTLRNNEQKQVTLLEGRGLGVTKKLVLPSQMYWFRSQNGQVQTNQKVAVQLEFENSQKNQLGVPLPKGTLRVYKADKAGSQQFVGEDAIDHTPRDEPVRVKIGDAFDVVGDRKQMKWTALGNCSSESAWEVELRNHKDTAVDIESIEATGGDWTIVSSSLPAERKDAQTFAFRAKVPPHGKVKITYVVRVRWC